MSARRASPWGLGPWREAGGAGRAPDRGAGPPPEAGAGRTPALPEPAPGARAGTGVHVTPAGLRFQLLRGEATQEELEILAVALDRLAALERGGDPGPWARVGRPGAGPQAWPAGTRWAAADRASYGRLL
jgi:hypothetical protein